MMPVFAAVDIGASGGRVMAGVVEHDRVALEPVHRFANGVAEVDGHLRWAFTTLCREVVAGLERIPGAVSIGIDTWAVDYGLLDAEGTLLAEPIAYRDDRTTRPARRGNAMTAVEAVHALVPPDEMYAINGLQFLPFNTIYQLAAERGNEHWSDVAHAVLIPDLVAHRLTGELGTEVTNASTTGLIDARSREWSSELFTRLDLPPSLLPPLQPPGELRGRTAAGTAVVTVGSHDTASAVVAVPATTERFAYIASGTWSLVGVELPDPVLTAAARAANFTNEIGVDGRTRFLRNVGGLWLLQESMRAWQRDDIDDLVAAAGRLGDGGPHIDVDDPAWIPPGAMPERIATAAGRPSMSPVETTRCILDSLAAGYAKTVEQASALTGRDVDVIHVVGGGSQNAVLCQLTADAAGVPVLAGPVEATALGNVLVQARAHEAMPASLDAMRSVVASSITLRRYEPR